MTRTSTPPSGRAEPSGPDDMCVCGSTRSDHTALGCLYCTCKTFTPLARGVAGEVPAASDPSVNANLVGAGPEGGTQ